jgi:precorrin-2 dehydrogenase/sirohydrochlorin ferrochelatase
MASLFPLFLRLEGRRTLLVGAGSIASQKLESLLSAEAQIHVVAPEASESVQELAREGRLCWSKREFRASDLTNVILVIAATGNPTVNEIVFREARARGVLCNAVDEPERCDFYYPAVVRRGDLQIAISTAGHSPALAQRIRRELETQFSPEYAGWLAWLGAVRTLFFRRPMDSDRRRNALHRIASSDVYERFVQARTAKGVAR